MTLRVWTPGAAEVPGKDCAIGDLVCIDAIVSGVGAQPSITPSVPSGKLT